MTQDDKEIWLRHFAPRSEMQEKKMPNEISEERLRELEKIVITHRKNNHEGMLNALCAYADRAFADAEPQPTAAVQQKGDSREDVKTDG